MWWSAYIALYYKKNPKILKDHREEVSRFKFTCNLQAIDKLLRSLPIPADYLRCVKITVVRKI